MNNYINNLYLSFKNKYSNEKEYLNALYEILSSISDYVDSDKSIEESGIIESLLEPDNIITFDVLWVNDKGVTQKNKGYRVQYSNVLGPYKGGLRFHPSVNLSIFKCLGLEQIFKNALTGLNLGGAKGGSDFDPKGKSENEIKNFCYAFMKELYPYIGSKIDVPAGDIGVGQREIKYLLEAYYKYSGNLDKGVLTGKPIELGGSLGRKEATGYGLCFFTERVLNKIKNTSLKGKNVIISGSGNVALYTLKMANMLGAKCIAISDSTGYVYNENGIDFNIIRKIKEDDRVRIIEYTKLDPKATFISGSNNIWTVPCDIAFPCATQNELNLDNAIALYKNGCIGVFEGANMPCTLDATNFIIENEMLFSPGKASNCGGVMVSGFEMIQNASNESWSEEEVFKKLKIQMEKICDEVFDTARDYGVIYNSVKGANIVAFKRVYNAMLK